MIQEDLVRQTLDFFRYKLDNNLCTMEEIDSVAKMLESGMKVMGTVEDFAKFCETSEGNVRNVINRKVLDKPKRRVYYRFLPFIKNVPTKWLKNK